MGERPLVETIGAVPLAPQIAVQPIGMQRAGMRTGRDLLAMGQVISERIVSPQELAAQDRFFEDTAATTERFIASKVNRFDPVPNPYRRPADVELGPAIRVESALGVPQAAVEVIQPGFVGGQMGIRPQAVQEVVTEVIQPGFVGGQMGGIVGGGVVAGVVPTSYAQPMATTLQP